jgi:threonine dehydratase
MFGEAKHPSDRQWPCAAELAAAVAGASAGADHERLARLLARLVCGGAQRDAWALPEAPLARRSAERAADTPRQTKRLLMIPTIEDVKAAAKRIEGIAFKTPLIRNDVLDEITGAKVWVKAENLQRGGAFKMRGATNAIAALAPEVRAKGVIAFSSGNHAIAVSDGLEDLRYQGDDRDAVGCAEDKTRHHAQPRREVVTYDRVGESREEIGARLAAEGGLSLIKPFDDPFVLAGQGTAGLEIAERFRRTLCSCPRAAAAFDRHGAWRCRRRACSRWSRRARRYSAHAGKRAPFSATRRASARSATACSPIRWARSPIAIARERFERVFVVSNEQVLRAMKFAFLRLKLVLEPSGAASLAALLEGGADVRGQTVAIIASGGNVDVETFERALAA